MEDLLTTNEQVLKDRQNSLRKEKAKLAELRRDLEDKMAHIDQVQLFIKNNVIACTELLKLNIGGTRFVTSNQLFTANPRSVDSMLSAMFSGRYATGGTVDSDGYYFLDRDPEPFELILTFLRCGYIPDEKELPRTSMAWKRLMLEIEFYGLSAMQEAILLGEIATDLGIALHNPHLEELLNHIGMSDDRVVVLDRLGRFHQAATKGHHPRLIRRVEEAMLEVLGRAIECSSSEKNPPKIKSPMTMDFLEDFLLKRETSEISPETLTLLHVFKRSIPKFKSLLYHLRPPPVMSPSPNVTLAEGGLLVTKAVGGVDYQWNCGVIAAEPLPVTGVHDWSVQLIRSCTNLMVGVSRKEPFKLNSANYSANVGHYLYCFNGCLYGPSQAAWGNLGAINGNDVIIRVICDMDKKEISFSVPGKGPQLAFRNVDVNAGLYPVFDLYENGCSFRIF